MLRRESPVARFVVMILVIVALVLFGALGMLNHFSERARRQSELRENVRVLADQLAVSLALPVWNFDQPQVDKITDSVMHDRAAEGVIVRLNDVSSGSGFKTCGLVRNEQGTVRPVTEDRPEASAGKVREERPIFANGEQVGSLAVFFTTGFMEEGLRNHMIYQAGIFVTLGVILTAGLYVLLWRTVLRPLRVIEQYAGEVSSGESTRLAGGRRFRGELERLRSSIERMVDLLAARYASLQRNEAMLSVVLNSAPQSIFWKDGESKYLGCNETFARLVGLPRPNLIVGKTDDDFPSTRGDAERYRADDREVMSTRTAKRNLVEEMQAADGTRLLVESSKLPLLDASSRAYGVLGVFEDITARVESERRMASQLRFEELVAGISSQLVAAEPGNLQGILSRALEDIGRMLDADRVVLGQMDEQTGEMVGRAHYRRTDPPFPDRLVISERYPYLWRMLRAGEVSHIRDVAALGDEQLEDRRHFEEVGIQSQVTAPVLVEGRLQYILAVASVGRAMDWSDEAVSRIKVLAEVLATTALRCEAEEVVRSSERQFRTFIEQAPVPIILVPSPDRSPIYFNPAFTRIFGYTREDIRRPEDWWPQLLPDAAYRSARHAKWEAMVAKMQETGGFEDTGEVEMRTKAGESRFAQVRIAKVEGYRMSFFNDLTERRQAETALRLTQYAVDHNPVMIFRVDMEGRFAYANDAACERFGYGAEEILHLHIWDVARTVTAESWPERSKLLREQGSITVEGLHATRSGATFPAEVRIQFVEFSGQQMFFAFADDITDRKAAQEAERAYTRRIQRLATELTRAEERQRRELATILHDGVGQNLFAATTQLLTIRDRAGASQAEVDKALSLLDQVTRDTRDLTFELCPPVLYQLGLIPALQRLADQFAKRHGVACTLAGHTSGPVDLNARGLAYQAVRELLNNAAKHAGAKKVLINVVEADGQVQIELADDGAGFDPVRLQPGIGGFGLFQLRERIELLGGTLLVDSAPQRGCRVQLRLPLNALQGME